MDSNGCRQGWENLAVKREFWICIHIRTQFCTNSHKFAHVRIFVNHSFPALIYICFLECFEQGSNPSTLQAKICRSNVEADWTCYKIPHRFTLVILKLLTMWGWFDLGGKAFLCWAKWEEKVTVTKPFQIEVYFSMRENHSPKIWPDLEIDAELCTKFFQKLEIHRCLNMDWNFVFKKEVIETLLFSKTAVFFPATVVPGLSWNLIIYYWLLLRRDETRGFFPLNTSGLGSLLPPPHVIRDFPRYHHARLALALWHFRKIRRMGKTAMIHNTFILLHTFVPVLYQFWFSSVIMGVKHVPSQQVFDTVYPSTY